MMNTNFDAEGFSVAVMHLREFMAHLPNHFYWDYDGKVTHDPEKVNFFVDDQKKFISAAKKVIKVNSFEEFVLLKKRMLTQRTYFVVTLCAEMRKDNGTTDLRRHHIVVCINPDDPAIRTQLEDSLDRCEILYSKEKHFCLRLTVGPMLRRWYEIVQELPPSFAECYNSTICITNFREECFLCYTPILWLTMLPLMLLFGVPYLIYRNLVCEDIEHSIKGFVTLMMDTGGTRRELQSTSSYSEAPLSNSVYGPPPPYDVLKY